MTKISVHQYISTSVHLEIPDFFRFFCFVTLLVFLSSPLSAQVPAKDCSTFTPDYYIGGGSPVYLSSLGLPSPIIGKTFVIDADLVIDKVVTFQRCLFKVAPGKKITIITNKTVIFYQCNLYSCGDNSQRWFGINMLSNTYGMLTVAECKIENALNAIYMLNQSMTYFCARYNDFFNNHMGIYIKGDTEFKIQYNFGNKFHGTFVSSIHPVLLEQLPAYGIKIEGLSTKLLHYNVGSYYTSEGAVTPNEFYNLYIAGIQLDYGYSKVIGCNFSNFFDFPGTGTYFPIEGAGIVSNNSDLYIDDYAGDPYTGCFFTTLDFGVYVSGTNRAIMGSIRGCSFSDCPSYAIQAYLPTHALDFSVYDNTFSQIVYSSSPFYAAAKSYTCVRIDGTADNYGVDYNTFNSSIAFGTSAPIVPSYQVFMNGYGAGGSIQPAFGTMLENTFNNSITGGTHFYMANYQNTDWLVMEGNTFTGGLNANYTTNWQAAFFDCANAYVRYNTFNYSHSTDNIHFQGLENFKFCTNTLQKSDNVGVHAYYINHIDLSKTQFGEHPTGLYLDKVDLVDPIIGVQFHRENCWPNTGFLGKAQNDAALPGNVNASKFTVAVTNPCHKPAIVNPSYWFGTGNGTSTDCQSDNPPGLLEERQYSDMSWEEQYEWYKAISARGAQNDYETSFMNEAQQSGIPELVNLENQIADAVNTKEADFTELNHKATAINAIYEEISAILKEGENGHLEYQDSVQLNALINEVSPIIAAYTELGNSVTGQKQAALQQVSAELNNTNFSDPHEITYQKYLSLVIMAHQAGNNQDEIRSLAAELAAKDHYAYGHGARKAHHFIADEAYQDYIAEIAQTCKDHPELLPGTNTIAHATNSNVSKIAKNVFEIAGFSETGSDYKVLDLTGKVIHEGEISLSSEKVDLSGFQPGIYYIAFANGAQTQKLFVEP